MEGAPRIKEARVKRTPESEGQVEKGVEISDFTMPLLSTVSDLLIATQD